MQIKELFNNNKINKKVFIVFLVVLVPTLLLIINQYRVIALEKQNSKDKLELSVLRQGEAFNSEQYLKNKNKIKDLEKKVSRILDPEEYESKESYQIDKVKAEIKQQAIKEANASSDIEYVAVNEPTQEQKSSEANALGMIEIYDPARKEISIYKEPSTNSLVKATIKVGEEVEYYKKTSGWYLIALSDKALDGWVADKNVRLLKNE